MERQGDRANEPDRRLFRATRRLPRWVRGPVDLRAFRRRASRDRGDGFRWVRDVAGSSSEIAAGRNPLPGTASLA
jgi:hypothetical protein